MHDETSSRGLALAAKIPTFFDVLKDLWDPESNPRGIVNLGLAENALLQEEMKEFINSHLRVDSHALTYGDGFSGSIKLQKSLCHFLDHYFQPHIPLEPSQVLITSGASNAIECCAWCLCDPGDYVLIGCPYWTTFRNIFGNRARVNVLEVQFGGIDPFGLEAVECYRRMHQQATEEGKNIKAILLCSPNNPLGRCYPEEILRSYMRICNELDVHLISDELYALSVWENPEMENPIPFKSILSLDIGNLMNPQKAHVIWGMSKDFGATGLRIGCLISQSNTQFLDSCRSISLFNFPLADGIVSELLADDNATENLISLNRARLSDNYQHVTKLLKAYGIPYTQSNAALFVWIYLGSVASDSAGSDSDILDNLRREKVYITAGSTYASEKPGWFRIVIAHPKHILDEGFKRIIQAISLN